MDEELALRAAVVANPEDDTPRVVFADWLDDHRGDPCPRCAAGRFPGYFGDDSLADAFAGETEDRRCTACRGSGKVFPDGPEQAELIRVQCEIARLGGRDPASPLRPRERELLRRLTPAFRRELRIDRWNWNWRIIADDGAGGDEDYTAVVSRGFISAVTCPGETWTAHADALRRRHPVTTVTLTTWPQGVIPEGVPPPFILNLIYQEWFAERWPDVKLDLRRLLRG